MQATSHTRSLIEERFQRLEDQFRSVENALEAFDPDTAQRRIIEANEQSIAVQKVISFYPVLDGEYEQKIENVLIRCSVLGQKAGQVFQQKKEGRIPQHAPQAKELLKSAYNACYNEQNVDQCLEALDKCSSLLKEYPSLMGEHKGEIGRILNSLQMFNALSPEQKEIHERISQAIHVPTYSYQN